MLRQSLIRPMATDLHFCLGSQAGTTWGRLVPARSGLEGREKHGAHGYVIGWLDVIALWICTI
jgi:hypothetical protein